MNKAGFIARRAMAILRPNFQRGASKEFLPRQTDDGGGGVNVGYAPTRETFWQ